MAITTRRMEQLIRRVRDDTGNTSYSATNGISQTAMVEFLNDGQDALQSAIINAHSQSRGAFIKTSYLDVVAHSNSVTLPSDMFFSGGILKLEYSASGNDTDFYRLNEITLGESMTNVNGDPISYSREAGSIILSPVPQASVSSGLRIKYVQKLPRLDVRRGKVSAITLNSGARTITTLTLDISDPTFDSVGLLENDYICIVDKDGLQLMKDIPITAVNTGTGVVSVDTFVYAVGETLPVGAYAVSGKNTTTHAQLPNSVEMFLTAYAKWMTEKRDSNDNSGEMTDELSSMLSQIVDNWSALDSDLQTIPIVNAW